MKLQHDTHYLNRKLDVRYVVKDKVSPNHFWSKHSLYNPNNVDNTEEVSEYGITYDFHSSSKDIISNSALCIQRDDENFILLQNFEFVNYCEDKLISTLTKQDYNFTFLADKDAKQGCIRVVKYGDLNIHEFPMIAAFTEDSCTIEDKLNNLYGCLKWK